MEENSGYNLIEHAIHGGNLEIFKSIEAAGAKVEPSYLNHAVRRNSMDIVNYILLKYPSTRIEKNVFLSALRSGHFDMARHLISNKLIPHEYLRDERA